MKIAYLDCPTGIAGDMCLGALIDAGLPLEDLETALAGLGLTQEYQLRREPVQRRGIAATQLHVELQGEPPPIRTLKTIEALIQNAHLPEQVEAWSIAVFLALATAEAAVHGSTPEAVHFHEVGATDALVDIVGTCFGLHWLGIEAIYCSPLPTGGGTVRAAHGRLPVPVPAVLKLWQMAQVPVYGNGIDRELVTPTGAAIVATLAQSFGPCPPLRLETVGLGAGSHDLPIPNILRLWIGESATGRELMQQHHHSHNHDHHPDDRSPHQHHGHSHHTDHHHEHPHDLLTHDHEHPHDHSHNHDHDHADRPQNSEPTHPSDQALAQREDSLEPVVLLQTQLDDLNPQVLGYLFDRLLAEGALDVFTTAIGMKKSRPGILLNVLCPPDRINSCEALIFAETSTLGIRRSFQERHILQRRMEEVTTPYGSVRIKIAWQGDDTAHPTNVQPEYEDCATIARQHHLPWKHIHQMALIHWYQNESQDPEAIEFQSVNW